MRRCLSVALLVLIGCPSAPIPVAKFKQGEIVVIITTGEKVMIVYVHHSFSGEPRKWEYKCRVSGANEKAVHGLVSMRTKTQVYPLVWFYEFELREAE